MSNPFDDLPALTRATGKREREEEKDEKEEGKRKAATHEEEEEAPAAEAPPPAPRPPSPKKKPRTEDEKAEEQVSAALARLTPHMRAPARLLKAGPLLRQLLDGAAEGGGGGGAPAFDPARHAPEAFAAIAAAFADPSQFLAAAPAARLEYARLARSAQRVAWGGGQAARAEAGAGAGGGEGDGDDGAAAAAEAASLYCAECAAAWALLRLEMLSAEDGFALSRALGKLKALIDALPPWEEGDEVEEEEEAGEEAGEDKAPPPPQRKRLPPPPPPPVAWPPSSSRVLLLRRRAALDCALCARDHCHPKAWAATAVEMSLEHAGGAAARAGRFAPGAQRARAEGLLDFVSSARAARRAQAGGGGGGAGGGKGDDRGAFERARAQFASAGNVSARGSVGSKGGGSAQWLG